MASIHEILQLDKNQSAIKKIDMFLAAKVKLSDEYMLAISYKARILHELKKSNDGLRLLLPFINDFKVLSYDSMLAVSDSIIYIYLDLEMFDEAIKYINLKRNYLPASRLHLFMKDKINLYLKMKDNKRAKEAILSYLNDDLNKEEAMSAREKLLDIYYEEKQYDKYLELSKVLEAYYTEYVFLDKLSLITIRRIEIDFYKKNYLKVIGEGNKFLEETSRVDYILLTASLCIRAYIELMDYKKASIFESAYEDMVTDEHPKEALEFSYAALELYKRTNSQISIKGYLDKIKHLEEVITPPEKKKRRAKPHKNEEEIITSTPIKDELRPSESFVTPSIKLLNPEMAKNSSAKGVMLKPLEVEVGRVSESFNRLIKIVANINTLDLNIKFRELYRKSLIEMCKEYNIDDVYLLYYQDKYKGLEYRHERAYDRKIEFSDIEDTLAYAAIKYDSEVVLDLSLESFDIDIVSHERYLDTDFAVAIPIHDSLEVIGSLTFRASSNILEDLSIEGITLITELINNRLLMEIRENKLKENMNKLYFLSSSMREGIKEEKDSYIHLNKRAIDILGTMENLRDDDYFSHLETPDIMKYKEAREKIYNSLTNTIELEYDFLRDDKKKIRIHEAFYPLSLDGNIIIYSIISDVTTTHMDNKRLAMLAYRDPISNCYKESKLINDLAINRPERLSLAIFELGDFALYKEIYGYNFSNQLILALANALNEAISSDFKLTLYHLERDRFAILFKNSNDKRLIDSKLRAIFLRARDSLKSLNKRLNISFSCGVYRVGSQNANDKYDAIIARAYDALYDSLQLDGPYPHISHYNSDLSKIRLNESSLITHISEAIDSNLIGLTYKQIISIKEGSVYGYNAIINLDNYEIDKSYMDRVIDRRGLRKRVDKYSLNKLFQEERIIYDELNGYIRMVIEVKNESIDISFYDYLNKLSDFYKLEREYIIIKCEDPTSPSLKALRNTGFKLMSSNILDVYRGAIDYLSYNYHEVNIESIDEIMNLTAKHNVICILGGIDSKEDIELARSKGYDLIYGNYYRKLNRVRGIIENVKGEA